MTIHSLKPAAIAENLPVEQLAGNKSLSEKQKIEEVSRRFEAVGLARSLETQLTRQTSKPEIKEEP